MPSTVGLLAAQALGGGAMMMALPPFRAIMALLTGVADGLVDGRDGAHHPDRLGVQHQALLGDSPR